ncbi:HBL/NHE enterotoxin family protein [Streptomyces flavidovirens]
MSDAFTTYKSTNENITNGAKKMLAGYGSQMVIIEAYALSLERQPDVDLAGLGGKRGTDLQKEINKLLGDARSLASSVLNSTPTGVILVKEVQRFYQDQKDFFELLKKNTPPVREVQQELKELHETACRQREAARTFAKTMSDARKKFNEQSGQFKTYAGQVRELLQGSHGVIDTLNQKIKLHDATISDLNRKIVFRVLEIGAGVVLVIVGVWLGPAGIPLVAGGVGMVVDGIKELVSTIQDLQAEHAKRSQVLADKARAQRQLVLAEALEPSLMDLSVKAGDAGTAAQALFATWSSLANSLDNVQNRVTRAQDVRDLSDTLRPSGLVRACDETVTVANKLHDQLTKTEKKIDTKKDIGKAIGESVRV